MNNETKKPWFPVYAPDNGGVTDNVIMEGDPINGDLIGYYRSMGDAHYYSRLHNEHVSSDLVLQEVQSMYQSEIHFFLNGFWDAGIEWYLGPMGFKDLDEYESGVNRGCAETVEEALVEMVNAARRQYPESTFARGKPSDIHLEQDQRTVEDLSRELGEIVGDFDLEFRPPQSHPYEPSWTIRPVDRVGGITGYTVIGVLRSALEWYVHR